MGCPGGKDSGEKPYFPLEKGRNWAYDVVMESFRGREVQKSFVTGLGSRNLDGRVIAARLLHNGETHYYENKAEGLARVAMRKPEWVRPNVESARRGPLSDEERIWLLDHLPKD